MNLFFFFLRKITSAWQERPGTWQVYLVAADLKHTLPMERILVTSASKNRFLPG